MALERCGSADCSESTHGSTCKSISHLSASNYGEETIPSGSGSRAVSTANIAASSTGSGSQCSQSRSTNNQHRSLGSTSHGSGDPFHQRLADPHTTQPTTGVVTRSLMSVYATHDHGLGIPGSKQHSACKVTQWLQDQKRDNRVPYLGVMQHRIGHEGSDLRD